MIFLKKLAIYSVLLIIFTSISAVVLNPKVGAEDDPTSSTTGQTCESSKSIFGIPTWYKYLKAEIDHSGKCSPILTSNGGSTDVKSSANNALPIGLAVLEALLRVSGLVAVVMVFIGAFKYILSRGNSDSAKGARMTIINSLIGLVIVIISSGVVNFIGNRLG